MDESSNKITLLRSTVVFDHEDPMRGDTHTAVSVALLQQKYLFGA